jgi:glutathione peroxidase
MATVHDFEVKAIDGKPQSLRDYAGKTLLVVNVASRCGLTPQYSALEALQQRFKGRPFAVLGFPCNDFAAQEPGSEAEIKDFCESNYHVTFPLFSKLHVKGDEQAPLYTFLTTQKSAPDGPGDVSWNFAKFVVDGDGKVIARFSPTTTPDAPELVKVIEGAVGG